MSEADGHSATTFADKLNRLLDVRRKADGKRYTLREVAEGVSTATKDDPDGQVAISYSYLSQLCTGSRPNPGLDVVRGIVAFFNVDPAYFLGKPDEVDAIEADLALSEAMQDTGVRDIAVRAGKLSAEGKRALAAFIAHLERPID